MSGNDINRITNGKPNSNRSNHKWKTVDELRDAAVREGCTPAQFQNAVDSIGNRSIASDAALKRASRAADNRCRILLIEDDPRPGPTTFHTLVLLGHKVMLATSAPSAFHYLSVPHQFDMVLLDLERNDKSGESMIKKLRAEGIEVPPLVISSTQSSEELGRVAQLLGAVGFIHKPASIAQIHNAILKTVPVTDGQIANQSSAKHATPISKTQPDCVSLR